MNTNPDSTPGAHDTRFSTLASEADTLRHAALSAGLAHAHARQSLAALALRRTWPTAAAVDAEITTQGFVFVLAVLDQDGHRLWSRAAGVPISPEIDRADSALSAALVFAAHERTGWQRMKVLGGGVHRLVLTPPPAATTDGADQGSRTVDGRPTQPSGVDALAETAGHAMAKLAAAAKDHAEARHALVSAVLRLDFPQAAAIDVDLYTHIHEGAQPYVVRIADNNGGTLWSRHTPPDEPLNEDVPAILYDALTAVSPEEAGYQRTAGSDDPYRFTLHLHNQ